MNKSFIFKGGIAAGVIGTAAYLGYKYYQTQKLEREIEESAADEETDETEDKHDPMSKEEVVENINNILGFMFDPNIDLDQFTISIDKFIGEDNLTVDMIDDVFEIKSIFVEKDVSEIDFDELMNLYNKVVVEIINASIKHAYEIVDGNEKKLRKLLRIWMSFFDALTGIGKETVQNFIKTYSTDVDYVDDDGNVVDDADEDIPEVPEVPSAEPVETPQTSEEVPETVPENKEEVKVSEPIFVPEKETKESIETSETSEVLTDGGAQIKNAMHRAGIDVK